MREYRSYGHTTWSVQDEELVRRAIIEEYCDGKQLYIIEDRPDGTTVDYSSIPRILDNLKKLRI